MRNSYDRYNSLKHQIRDVEGLLATHRQQVMVQRYSNSTVYPTPAVRLQGLGSERSSVLAPRRKGCYHFF